ncbi:MAG: hypothetical protein ACLU30_15760 [Odoribacter splanchnicus]
MDGFTASIGNDAERAYAFGFFMGGILLLFWGYIAVLYPNIALRLVPRGIACC